MDPGQEIQAAGHLIAVPGVQTGKTMFTQIARGMSTGRKGTPGSRGQMETGRKAKCRYEPVQALSVHVQPHQEPVQDELAQALSVYVQTHQEPVQDELAPTVLPGQAEAVQEAP